MSGGDIGGLIGGAVVLLGFVGAVVAWVNKVTNGAHLRRQDEKLGNIEDLAQKACEEAKLARSELSDHVRREELAFAAPWWRRRRMRL